MKNFLSKVKYLWEKFREINWNPFTNNWSVIAILLVIIVGTFVGMGIDAYDRQHPATGNNNSNVVPAQDQTVHLSSVYSYVPDGCLVTPNADSVIIHPVMWVTNNGYGNVHVFMLHIDTAQREWIESSPCGNPVIIKR